MTAAVTRLPGAGAEARSRAEGARRASVLRYGGSLWVSGYWPRTTLTIELRPVRSSPGRLILIGPPAPGGRSAPSPTRRPCSGSSIALDLAGASLVALAEELATWLETPSLPVRHAERSWPAVARSLAAHLIGGSLEEVPA